MTVTIELSPQEEAELAAEADREGLDSASLVKQCVVQRLSHADEDVILFSEWKAALVRWLVKQPPSHSEEELALLSKRSEAADKWLVKQRLSHIDEDMALFLDWKQALAKWFAKQPLSHTKKDLELLAKWKREDALLTPEQRAEEREIWEEFEKGINDSRHTLGMREL